MNKKEFIDALSNGIEALPKEDRMERIAYYQELIEDMIEDEMNEIEAVERLGDPNEIAKDILREQSVRTFSTNSMETDRDCHEGTAKDTQTFDGHRGVNDANAKSDEYEVSANGIHSFDIDWMAGSVEVCVEDVDSIQLKEFIVSYEFIHGIRWNPWRKYRDAKKSAHEVDMDVSLRYWIEDGILHVRYCDNSLTGTIPAKNLTVIIPSSLESSIKKLGISTASADVDLDKVNINELKLSSASGSLTAKGRVNIASLVSASGTVVFNGEYKSLKASTVSGKVQIISRGEKVKNTEIKATSGSISMGGKLGSLKVKNISGNIISENTIETWAEYAEISTVSGRISLYCGIHELRLSTISGKISMNSLINPHKIGITTVSGRVELVLKKDVGFTLGFSTGSGEFNCEFPVMLINGKYVVGDGKGDFNIKSRSGNVCIASN